MHLHFGQNFMHIPETTGLYMHIKQYTVLGFSTESYWKRARFQYWLLLFQSTLKMGYSEAFWSNLKMLRVCCRTFCFKMFFILIEEKKSLVLIQISKGTLKMNEHESIFSEAGVRYMSSKVMNARLFYHFPPPLRNIGKLIFVAMLHRHIYLHNYTWCPHGCCEIF